MSGLATYSGRFGGLLLHNKPLKGGSGPSKLEGIPMTFVKSTVLAIMVGVLFPVGAAMAKPSLRDVPEIENTLFAVALADEISDQCSSIKPRFLKGLGVLRRLRSQANELGYSDSEIRAYVESKSEKTRMRAKGEKYLTANGVQYNNPETFCTFGRAEIAKSSAIGVLLKAK